ncbi:MAG: DUF4129 domain-containing protein [Gammaproteobacteria bacterium]
MDLEHLSINVRPRKGWEAVDLGLNLVQAHARAVLLPVGVVVFGVAVLALLIAPMDWWSWLPGLVLWWLKPLYDRVVLYVLSRAVFGELCGWRQTLARLPSLVWGNGLWVDLTLRRLQLARAFVLPVRQLEGMRGSERARRVAVLRQHAGALPSGLQLLWLHLESAVSLGLLFLVFVMVPEQFQGGFAEAVVADDTAPWLMILSTFIYAFALTVMESFYAAAGFALYLNRRVQLEGWDLEIALRRMQRRFDLERAVGSASALASLIAVLLVTVLTITPSAPAYAASLPTPDVTAADAGGVPGGQEGGALGETNRYQRTIQEILEDRQFGYTETAVRYDLDFGAERDEPVADETPKPDFTTLSDLFKALPRIAEVLLWLAIGFLVVWLLTRLPALRAGLRMGVRASRRDDPAPDTLFGLDVRPESLPDDVPAAVMELWSRGEGRAALALLYRGTLSAVLRVHPLPVGAGATEGDVLRVSRSSLSEPQFEALEQITRTWQAMAYAHREPAEPRVQGLCDRWRREFETASPAGKPSDGSARAASGDSS